MSRLPQPGGDDNAWGTILNDFLSVAHNVDGTLKNSAIAAINRSITAVASNIAAGATAQTDYVYLANGAITITLPTAVNNTNRYTITNVGTSTVTVATSNSQTINGSTTATLPLQYMSLDFISDNANWIIE